MENFDVIFDSDGGVTIQTDSYCHHTDCPDLAAETLNDILNGEQTCNLGGNQPERRLEYHSVIGLTDRFEWHEGADVIQRLEDMPKDMRTDWLAAQASRKNVHDFYAVLFDLRP